VSVAGGGGGKERAHVEPVDVGCTCRAYSRRLCEPLLDDMHRRACRVGHRLHRHAQLVAVVLALNSNPASVHPPKRNQYSSPSRRAQHAAPHGYVRAKSLSMRIRQRAESAWLVLLTEGV
jgi:hypothetical protein